MSFNEIRTKQVTRDARLHAFAGSLINHCFVAWFISLYWNFPAFIFNFYSEISTYLSTTPVQNIIKHALLMIFVHNFRSVARTVQ